MRNLSMKKFGTPTGAGPGVASEKVGLLGVGALGPSLDDDLSLSDEELWSSGFGHGSAPSGPAALATEGSRSPPLPSMKSRAPAGSDRPFAARVRARAACLRALRLAAFSLATTASASGQAASAAAFFAAFAFALR